MNKLRDYYDYINGEIYVPLQYRSKMYTIEYDDFLSLVREYKSGLVLTEKGKREVDLYLELVKTPSMSVTLPSVVIMLTMLSYVEIEKKLVIDCAFTAYKYGKLRSYFGERDYLQLFYDESPEEYDYIYSDDYEAYVIAQFSRDEIARSYMKYISIQRDDKVVEVLEKLEIASICFDSSYKYVIVDDYRGILSAYCVIHDLRFLSWSSEKEPYMLGIVTSNKPLRTNIDVIENDILSSKVTLGEDAAMIKRKFLKNIFVYFYKTASVPLFPNQQYVVLSDYTVKRPGKYIVSPNCSTNNLMYANSTKQRFQDYYCRQREYKFNNVFPLDKESKFFAQNLRIPLSNMYEAQYLISFTRDSILALSKEIEDMRILSKVLYVPTWTFPFRLSSKNRIGKSSGGGLEIYYGSGEYYSIGSFKNIDKEIHSIESEYIFYGSMICIPGHRLSPVTRLILRPEDRVRFFYKSSIEVYMLSSVTVDSVVYGIYAEISNTRPMTFHN